MTPAELAMGWWRRGLNLEYVGDYYTIVFLYVFKVLHNEKLTATKYAVLRPSKQGSHSFFQISHFRTGKNLPSECLCISYTKPMFVPCTLLSLFIKLLFILYFWLSMLRKRFFLIHLQDVTGSYEYGHTLGLLIRDSSWVQSRCRCDSNFTFNVSFSRL